MLDIEGTVAPIAFVVETLFPYARARLASHLAATYAAPDTQAAIALFRQLVSHLRCAAYNKSAWGEFRARVHEP